MSSMPVSPETRARTLLTLLWKRYDASGASMGRSYEGILLEAAMDLLGPPDHADVQRLLGLSSNELLFETRGFLSSQRARQEGLIQDPQGQQQPEGFSGS